MQFGHDPLELKPEAATLAPKTGPLSGRLGFWGMRRDYEVTGEEALAPPTTQDAVAVFAYEELEFDKLRLQFGARIERNAYNPQVLTALIVDSCAIKAHLIGQDETGRGVRATLYYGHTFGHAIEAVTGYGRLSHGEAVAIGMVCAAEMARERGMIGSEFCDRQRGILQAAGLATSCPGDVDAGEIVDAMALDENVVGGRIRFIVPTGVGGTEIRYDFSSDEAERAITATR